MGKTHRDCLLRLVNDVAVAYVSFNRHATRELLGWYENCMRGQNCFVWMSQLMDFFFEFDPSTPHGIPSVKEEVLPQI